jgi:hypothetical protein
MSEPAEDFEEQTPAWINALPSQLQPAALKHGEALFKLTMDIGMSNHALAILQRRTRRNNELTKALLVLSGILNNLANTVLLQNNWLEDYQKCKFEIESAMPTIDTSAGGKIILPGLN